MKAICLLFALLVTACAMEPPTGAPAVRFVYPDDTVLESDKALADKSVLAWGELGFTITTEEGLEECPREWYDGGDGNCVVTIELAADVFYDNRGYKVAGHASREHRTIGIDKDIHGPRFLLTMTHEVGHILLDASHMEADKPGVMNPRGGKEVTQYDLDFACDEINICVTR